MAGGANRDGKGGRRLQRFGASGQQRGLSVIVDRRFQNGCATPGMRPSPVVAVSRQRKRHDAPGVGVLRATRGRWSPRDRRQNVSRGLARNANGPGEQLVTTLHDVPDRRYARERRSLRNLRQLPLRERTRVNRRLTHRQDAQRR